VYVKFARYNLKISHHLLLVITDFESGLLLTSIRCKAKENVSTSAQPSCYYFSFHNITLKYIIILSIYYISHENSKVSTSPTS